MKDKYYEANRGCVKTKEQIMKLLDIVPGDKRYFELQQLLCKLQSYTERRYAENIKLGRIKIDSPYENF